MQEEKELALVRIVHVSCVVCSTRVEHAMAYSSTSTRVRTVRTTTTMPGTRQLPVLAIEYCNSASNTSNLPFCNNNIYCNIATPLAYRTGIEY